MNKLFKNKQNFLSIIEANDLKNLDYLFILIIKISFFDSKCRKTKEKI